MAKLIFVKDEAKKQTSLCRMATDQSTLDLYPQYTSSIYDIVDLADSDFTNLQENTKYIASESGGTFTYENNGSITDVTHTAATCKEQQTHVLSIFDAWLATAPANALKTRAQTYRNTVNNIDFDTLFSDDSFSYPGTIEKYVSDQGNTPVHPLELL